MAPGLAASRAKFSMTCVSWMSARVDVWRSVLNLNCWLAQPDPANSARSMSNTGLIDSSILERPACHPEHSLTRLSAFPVVRSYSESLSDRGIPLT